MFYKKSEIKSHTMIHLYLNHNTSFGCEDSYNYYDIDVDKYYYLKKAVMNILLYFVSRMLIKYYYLKKSRNEYFVIFC